MKSWNEVYVIIAFFLPVILSGQPVTFEKDSIPVVDQIVTFNIDFEHQLTKEEFRNRVNLYINHKFRPVAGEIIENSINNTISEAIDYISIGDNFFQNYGLYMMYSMNFEYHEGLCHLTIHDISFLEKGYFDAYMDDSDKRTLPSLSAKEIMLDQELKLLFVKNVSERVTIATLERINEIINDVHKIFSVN